MAVRVSAPTFGREDDHHDGDYFTGDRPRVSWPPGPYSGRCDAYGTPYSGRYDASKGYWRQARCTHGPKGGPGQQDICAQRAAQRTSLRAQGQTLLLTPCTTRAHRRASSALPLRRPLCCGGGCVRKTSLAHAKTVGPFPSRWAQRIVAQLGIRAPHGKKSRIASLAQQRLKPRGLPHWRKGVVTRQKRPLRPQKLGRQGAA